MNVVKMLRCRDVGILDCDFVARGNTEKEIMRKVAEHAKKAHGISEISPDLAAKVKGAIKEV